MNSSSSSDEERKGQKEPLRSTQQDSSIITSRQNASPNRRENQELGRNNKHLTVQNEENKINQPDNTQDSFLEQLDKQLSSKRQEQRKQILAKKKEEEEEEEEKRAKSDEEHKGPPGQRNSGSEIPSIKENGPIFNVDENAQETIV